MRGAELDRGDQVLMANQHIQHMHKALTQMNVQIQHVISDITGLTGLAIVDSIIEGERNPAVLAKPRDPHIKASEETIRKSLEGNWRAEHVFTLKQSRNSYRHYQEQIAVCDEEIEKLLVALQPRVDPEERPLPPDRKAKQQQTQKEEREPEDRLRCAHRVVQTIRSGSDADSRTHGHDLDVVQ